MLTDNIIIKINIVIIILGMILFAIGIIVSLKIFLVGLVLAGTGVVSEYIYERFFLYSDRTNQDN